MAKIILGKVVGPEGKAATIEVDSTETIEAGSPALVENIGTENEARLKFSIPQGPKGNPGVTPEMSFDVEALDPDAEASVEVSGNAEKPHLVIKLPRGATGENGESAYLEIGTVTTLAPDEEATAEITGEAPNYILNLGLPRGQGISSADDLIDGF